MNNQIMITLQQIKDNGPCTDGWRKVLKANGGRSADFNKQFPVSSIIDSNDMEDTFWALRCLPEYDLLWRRCILWCALQVKDNTEDPRVHECLETVERFCDGEATEDELSEARLASWSASWPVLAESAAHSAARSASWSAALSYLAAWGAASSAARSAVLAARPASKSVAHLAVRSVQERKLREVLDKSVCVLR